jgi:hypothetical protein
MYNIDNADVQHVDVNTIGDKRYYFSMIIQFNSHKYILSYFKEGPP